MMALVADFSHWESVSDWSEVAEQIDGAYLKATQRHNWIDSTFNPNRKGCKSVNLPWGAYHFWEETTTGVVQANHFLSVLNGDYGQLPPCLDFEPFYIGQHPSRLGALSSIKSFVETVEQRTGIKPIFYSNPDHINFLKPVPDWLLNCGLWIADYSSPVIPDFEPWKSWVMWQFSDAGTLEGIDDAVDLNHAQDDFVSHVTQPELTLEQKVEKLWNDHYKIFPV
jgi:lysozyme